MSNVNFSLVTRPYSTTNTVRVNLYKTTDPLVIAESQDKAGPLGQEEWDFPGLERVNYICRILEVSGATILQEYDNFTFVPDADTEVKYKNSQTIIRTTPGVGGPNGNIWTMDGTGGSDDWRGWDISLIICNRLGILPEADYQYVSATGVLTLIGDYSTFDADTWFIVQFATQIGTGGGSVDTAGDLWKSAEIITNDYDILASDIGKKLVLRGDPTYFELNLPPINTVVPNRLLCIQSVGGNHKCVKINADSGDANSIEWLEGNRSNLYICQQEKLVLYRLVLDETTSVWAIDDFNGNWFRLGDSISNDGTAAMMFNKLPLDGGGNDGRTTGLDVSEYARFYYDFVANLPVDQLVSFSSWGTGDNIRKYSLASGGKFHIPDRRNMYKRQSDGTNKPGDYQSDLIGPHAHFRYPNGNPHNNMDRTVGGGSNLGGGGFYPLESNPLTGDVTGAGTGAETRPKSVIVNEYVYA